MKKHCRKILIILAIVYLSGPFIAGLCNCGDRRGPLIYPEFYHEIAFTLAWRLMPESPTHDGDKPRLAMFRTRPLFYGMEQGWSPRPQDPRWAEIYDQMRKR